MPRATSAPAPGAAAARCDAPFAGEGPLQFPTAGWRTDFCKHTVPYAQLRSGGPPRDGIPPIDAPKLVTMAEAGAWLRAEEPVIEVEIRGRARAYPLQILIWHEIVNDVLAGTPIAVTFCPLCYSAIVFERPRVDGSVLTFGTSGNLRNSDLVMWDRQTESWWQQFDGIAIVGSLTGRELTVLPAAIVSWQAFARAHPQGSVLSRETGFQRNYGQNPYVGYDDVAKKPFLFRGQVRGPLAPMARVLGVAVGTQARAYPRELLRAAGVVNDTLAGRPILVVWSAGTATALDSSSVAGGRDIGSARAFLRRVAGRTLTFAAAPDGVRDRETGSHWTFDGRATSGPLAGRRLDPLVTRDVFWFAWATFRPGGTIYEAPGQPAKGPRK